MAGDVYVTFGANTGELEAAMAKANAEVRALSRELSALAGEAQKTGAAADSELVGKLNVAAESLAQAKGHVRDLKEEMRGVGDAAQSGFGSIAGVLHGLTESFESALAPVAALQLGMKEFVEVAGILAAAEGVRRFAESMAELGLETEKATQILGVSSEDVAGLRLVAQATGTSLESLETQFARLSKNIVEGSKNAREAAAYFGLSLQDLAQKPALDALKAIADAYAALPPSIERTANAQLLIGRGAVQMAAFLAQGSEGIDKMQEMARRAGTTLDETMLASMKKTHEAGLELGAAMEGLGVSAFGELQPSITGALTVLADFVEEMSSAIREGGLLKDALWVLNAAFGGLEIVIATTLTSLEDLWNFLTAIKETGQALGGTAGLLAEQAAGAEAGISDQVTGADKVQGAWSESANKVKSIWKTFSDQQDDLTKKLQSEMEAITGKINEQTPATNRASEAAAELRKQFEGVLDAVKDTTSEIDSLDTKIETLQKGLYGGVYANPATSSASNGPATVGAGAMSNTVGGSAIAGQIADMLRSLGVSNKDAIAGFIGSTNYESAGLNPNAVNKDSGAFGLFQDLGSRKSALTAQYGPNPTPEQQIAFAKSELQGPEAAALAKLKGAGSVSEGVDASLAFERPSQDEIAKSRGDRVKLGEGYAGLGELQKKRDDVENGTPREQAELAALEAQVKGAGDELAAKQKIVAADQQALTLANDGKEKREAQKKLDEDTLSLRKAQTAAQEADLKLAAGRAKGDPGAEHAVELQAANLKMQQAKALYGEDSAQYKAAVAEKEAADRKFVSESNTLTREKLQEDIRVAQSTASESNKALDDALSHKRISTQQWLAQTHAVDEQERSTLQNLYAQEQAMTDQSVAQKLAAKNREADQMREIANREADDQRKAADQAGQEWNSIASGIVSSFTSALKGMISGHENFRQAATKALQGLADKAIDIIGKMVEKWLAGELAKTAATTTGVAARKAAETAGSAAGAVSQAGTILKSISASAGETFAGVFGFMSPVLGPAAAGPAAAAEGTVLSVAGGLVAADIGMWDVPSNMVAQIHKGELVMPATQASALRDMLSGSGASGKGVTVNPHTTFHVNSMDGRDVARVLRNNPRGLMKAVEHAVRSGAHHGLALAR